MPDEARCWAAVTRRDWGDAKTIANGVVNGLRAQDDEYERHEGCPDSAEPHLKARAIERGELAPCSRPA
jgi:hypothetical protein